MTSTTQASCSLREKIEDVRFIGSAFADLVTSIGHAPPETGGLLLGFRSDFVVKKFIFDESGSRSHASYDPDVTVLNKIVKREWEENGLQLIGWAHSHPRGVDRLSGDYGGGTGDIGYLNRIFCAMPALRKFIVPIIFSSNDGPLTIYPYVAYRENPANYSFGRLMIVAAPVCEIEDGKETSGPASSEQSKSKAILSEQTKATEKETQNGPTYQPTSISA